MKKFQHALLVLAVLATQFACSMNDLPRNMSLKAFDPHRPDFVCKHEADVVPPIDPEAEQWLQQGLVLTNGTLWPDQRDYKGAVQLWQKAADRKHWKAMLNLANAYAQGEGVQRDTEHAVQIIEQAMKLGIPAAFDVMGSYHMNGVGVKSDASRAYAFWELAADMGSANAQAYLGEKLTALYDNPPSFWGNRKVGMKMLECGMAQGNGKAAFELGVETNGDDSKLHENYGRALRIFHEGVKFGSAESASWLGSAFSSGEAVALHMKDPARSERYRVLAKALDLDSDLRLPNLDKVLPLPPARLPMWDGKKESLIEAAKAVVPTPPAKPTPEPAANPASKLTGKAHIPEGWMLPERPAIEVPAQYETTAAPEAGYWLARLMRPTSDEHDAWNAAQLPMQYARGELFDRTRQGLRDEDGRIAFHYVGQLVPVPPSHPELLLYKNPLVERGIARYGDIPETAIICKGQAACRKTGVWEAHVADDHALAPVFNQWHRQAYVQEGQAFPDPRDQHLDIAKQDVTWRWLDQANKGDPAGLMSISMDEPKLVAAATVEVAEEQPEAEASAQATGPAGAAPPQADTPSPSQAQAPQPDKGKPGLLDRLWRPRG